jgi:hypothetical protein
MVVSGGFASAAIGISSKPTTDRSRGTRTPCWAQASNAPSASRSFEPTIAVRRGRTCNSCVAAAKPPEYS